ncbi:MAG: cytidylate kinase-like family protein [candidate division Zixibacteria bacterium]|nr:cytidylate kinase-like family protein [candidate division Zixibacteria bacterium]
MNVITIAREFGSSGLFIARRIAERLGYDCVDKELIAEVARAAGVDQETVEEIDEVGETPVRRFLRELFTPSNLYALSPEYPPLIWPYASGADMGRDSAGTPASAFLDRGEYLRILQDTMRTLAQRGRVVIVGRGGQCLLADHPDTLHVCFVAPLENRIVSIMEEKGIDREKARQLVAEKDRQRALYLQQHYHQDWHDATMYHIIVNTSIGSIDRVADIVVDVYHRMQEP